MHHRLDGLEVRLVSGPASDAPRALAAAFARLTDATWLALLLYFAFEWALGQVAMTGGVAFGVLLLYELVQGARRPRGHVDLALARGELTVRPSPDLRPALTRIGEDRLPLSLAEDVDADTLSLAEILDVDVAGGELALWLTDERVLSLPAHAHRPEELAALAEELRELARQAAPREGEVPEALARLRLRERA